jgi:pimeloyl-ACP methyl ester carboxylesterase
VLAFDQRGCGGSADAPRGNYDLDVRVRDLSMPCSTSIRLERVVLVGQGTGVQVVARYAERNPARVRGLVLVNPVSGDAEAARVADLPDGELRPAIERWLGALLKGRATGDEEKVLASSEVARIPAMRAMLGDAASTDFPEASPPTRAGAGLAAPGEPVPGPLRPGHRGAPPLWGQPLVAARRVRGDQRGAAGVPPPHRRRGRTGAAGSG